MERNGKEKFFNKKFYFTFKKNTWKVHGIESFNRKGLLSLFFSFFLKFSDWEPGSFVCSVIPNGYLINIGTILWGQMETSNWLPSRVVQGALGGDKPCEKGSAWNEISKQVSGAQVVSSLWGGTKKLAANQLAVYVNEGELLQILVLAPAEGHCKLSTGHKWRLRGGPFKPKENKYYPSDLWHSNLPSTTLTAGELRDADIIWHKVERAP